MRGGNEAEVVIAFRAENEASAELEDIRNEAREADRGFQGLDRSVIATGLGFLGLGFGAKEAIQNFQEFTQSTGQIQGRLDLLGPAAQQAFDDLKPAFEGIGNTVAATEREIAEAFSIIIANSGGIAPSAAELAGAFDVARVAGVDFETTAAAIGQALQGNLEPLQQLLDPSGRRSIPSLAVGLDTVRDSARDAITPIDELTAAFRGFADSTAEAFTGETEVMKGFKQTLEDINELQDIIFGSSGSTDLAAQFPNAPSLQELLSQGDPFLAPPNVPDDLGFGSRPYTTTIIFNDAQVDSDERLNQLVRQIEDIIRNNNRSGSNISDQ